MKNHRTGMDRSFTPTNPEDLRSLSHAAVTHDRLDDLVRRAGGCVRTHGEFYPPLPGEERRYLLTAGQLQKLLVNKMEDFVHWVENLSDEEMNCYLNRVRKCA